MDLCHRLVWLEAFASRGGGGFGEHMKPRRIALQTAALFTLLSFLLPCWGCSYFAYQLDKGLSSMGGTGGGPDSYFEWLKKQAEDMRLQLEEAGIVPK